MEDIIIEAIENRNLLEFNYDGHYRVVEPHTYGIFKNGSEKLAAFQVDGTSDKGDVPDWKLFTVEKINGLGILEDTFNGTRPGYRQGDSRMVEIHAEL